MLNCKPQVKLYIVPTDDQLPHRRCYRRPIFVPHELADWPFTGGLEELGFETRQCHLLEERRGGVLRFLPTSSWCETLHF